MKFKIGDRVKAAKEPVSGLTGTVVGIVGYIGVSVPYLVSFEGFKYGHNGCQEWLTEGHALPEADMSGYWCTEDILQLDKRKFDIHAGDYIRIRQWDDMVKEFGMDGKSINCRNQFASDMHELCGKVYRVESVTETDDDVIYSIDTYEWLISDDMIECVIPTDTKVSKPFNVRPIKTGFCVCGVRVNEDQSFCPTCGRKLDWRE